MKKILKIIGLFIAGIITVLALWFCINQLDTKPSELSQELFFNQVQIPLEQNGDVYLKGFGVPLGQKPYDAGLQIYEDHTDKKIDDILEFHGNAEGLYCWFLQDAPKEEKCQSLEELQETISKNKTLLNRLEEMSKYDHFDEDMITYSFDDDTIQHTDYFRGQDFILLETLFNARLIALKKFGATEEAINLWIDNMNMLNNMLSSRQSMVFAAIVMITQNFTNDVITQLIDGYDIDADTLSRIKNALIRPAFGKNGMDLRKIYQAEYNNTFKQLNNYVKQELDNRSAFYAKNNTLNLFAEYANDVIKTSENAPDSFGKNNLHKKYSTDNAWNYLGLILYNPTGKLLLNGVLKSEELLKNRYQSTLKREKIWQKIEEESNN